MFRKLSILIGLTETEIKVLLFLLSAFLIGFSYKTFFQNNEDTELKEFDYSKEDSLFFAIGNDPGITTDDILGDTSVDYKHEVLDFNESSFSRSNPKELPAAKSLNLNSAKLEALILLPGIGEKTAGRILDLRAKKEKFNNLEELLEVKGIGEVKFQKIRKYLFIE